MRSQHSQPVSIMATSPDGRTLTWYGNKRTRKILVTEEKWVGFFHKPLTLENYKDVLTGKEIRQDGRLRFQIEYGSARTIGARAYPETIQIRGRRPSCRLRLTLRDLQPFEQAPGAPRESEP